MNQHCWMRSVHFEKPAFKRAGKLPKAGAPVKPPPCRIVAKPKMRYLTGEMAA